MTHHNVDEKFGSNCLNQMYLSPEVMYFWCTCIVKKIAHYFCFIILFVYILYCNHSVVWYTLEFMKSNMWFVLNDTAVKKNRLPSSELYSPFFINQFFFPFLIIIYWYIWYAIYNFTLLFWFSLHFQSSFFLCMLVSFHIHFVLQPFFILSSLIIVHS